MIDLLEPLYRAAIAILAIIVLTRINGLRSFSKMSSFDFALTVAVGSVLAGTIMTTDQNLMIGLIALLAIYLARGAIAILRQRFEKMQLLTDNQPLLLMDGPKMLHDNMRAARVSQADLLAKLREANVLELAQVRAVVMETTGDVSVLHASPQDDLRLDDVLEGVRRAV